MERSKNKDFAAEIISDLETIVGYWEKLDKLIRVEWQYLLKDDFSKLYKIFQAKQILSKQIAESEKELSQKLVSKFNNEKEEHASNLSKKLYQILGQKEGAKAQKLLNARHHFRQLTTVTNARIIAWLKERLSFFNELSDILSGNNNVKKTTYDFNVNSTKKNKFTGLINNNLTLPIISNPANQVISSYDNIQKNFNERAK